MYSILQSQFPVQLPSNDNSPETNLVWLSPSIIKAKVVVMQWLWERKINWDYLTSLKSGDTGGMIYLFCLTYTFVTVILPSPDSVKLNLIVSMMLQRKHTQLLCTSMYRIQTNLFCLSSCWRLVLLSSKWQTIARLEMFGAALLSQVLTHVKGALTP